MKRTLLSLLLCLLTCLVHGQDLYADIDNQTIPKDIARLIQESNILMEGEPDDELSQGALALHMLPLFDTYYRGSRFHLRTLLRAARYSYYTFAFQEAETYYQTLFRVMEEYQLPYDSLGARDMLTAYEGVFNVEVELGDYRTAEQAAHYGLNMARMAGDSLSWRIADFYVLLATLYGIQWSPLYNDAQWQQCRDSSWVWIRRQDLSRPGLRSRMAADINLLAMTAYSVQHYQEAWDLVNPFFQDEDPAHLPDDCLELVCGHILIGNCLGKYEETRKYAPEVIRYIENELKEVFTVYNERERQRAADSQDIYFDGLLSAAMATDFGDALGSMYDYLLFRKDLLLRSSLEVEDVLKQTEDVAARYYYANYRYLRDWRNDLCAEHSKDTLLMDSITNRLDQLDRMITFYAHQHGLIPSPPTWRDIQHRLSEHAVAVEFYRFYCTQEAKSQGQWYVAMVITHDGAHPYLEPLCTTQDLDVLPVPNWQEKILGPIEKYLHPGDTLYFAPYGSLHHIDIETCILPNGTVACDQYVMRRLSSTAQLMKDRQPQEPTAVLYGGLSYNLTLKTMLAEARRASRTRAGVDPLPYTKREVEQIGKTLKRNGFRVRLLTGSKGNEESFKALSGHAPAVLHLATHGFYKDFLDDETDPMLRGGLLLSGANAHALAREEEECDDGVLTALEISSMDLRGTDLVVLSACETWMGEVDEEGIWGLQRAFKMAGAGTLILTIGEVEEKPTELFMTTFYEAYSRKRDKVNAFRTAQQALRSAYPQDFYWESFIMLD